MNASATWSEGLSFTGTADSGFSVPMGTNAAYGGADDGFRPLELMLVSLAGCTGMDVVSILLKKRQQVTGFQVNVHAIGDRANLLVLDGFEQLIPVTGTRDLRHRVEARQARQTGRLPALRKMLTDNKVVTWAACQISETPFPCLQLNNVWRTPCQHADVASA